MPLKVRKQTVEGDYVFGGGSQDFFVGVEAVQQIILTRLKLLLNEWWEDVSDGLPLFQSILGASGTPDGIQGVDLLVQERILNTVDVTGIDSFESNFDSRSRTYSVACTVDTLYGQVTLEVTF